MHVNNTSKIFHLHLGPATQGVSGGRLFVDTVQASLPPSLYYYSCKCANWENICLQFTWIKSVHPLVWSNGLFIFQFLLLEKSFLTCFFFFLIVSMSCLRIQLVRKQAYNSNGKSHFYTFYLCSQGLSSCQVVFSSSLTPAYCLFVSRIFNKERL